MESGGEGGARQEGVRKYLMRSLRCCDRSSQVRTSASAMDRRPFSERSNWGGPAEGPSGYSEPCPTSVASNGACTTVYATRAAPRQLQPLAAVRRHSPLQQRYNELLTQAAAGEHTTRHLAHGAAPSAAEARSSLTYGEELSLAFCSVRVSGGQDACSNRPRARARSLGDWIAAWASPLRCSGPPAIE